MQISFDPRDRAACTGVLAAIFALHGELPEMAIAAPTPVTPETETRQVPISEGAVVLAPEPTGDEQPDPAAAFGTGNAPSALPAAPPAAATPPSPEPVASPPISSAPAAPSSGVELDADGLPWDGRIHSGPDDKKPKNADGRWRRKRGVGDAEVERVTAELRQVMGAPAPAPTPAAAPTPPPAPPVAADPAPPAPVAQAPTAAPTPPPPTPADASTGFGQAVAETAASAPPAPPVAATPPVAPPAAPAPAANFAELMKRITARQTAGTLTVTDTKVAAEALGLSGVADLLKRPDLIEAFEAALPQAAA